MKQTYFALVALVLFQSCMSSIIREQKSSTKLCFTIQQSYRCIACSHCLLRPLLNRILPTRRIFWPNLCSGCSEPNSEVEIPGEPESSTEPPCPPLNCLKRDCPHGKKETFLPNGCPACDECKEKPKCPPLDCTELDCPYGRKTVTSNNCPACDECLPKPPCKKLMCMEPKCTYGTVPSLLSNGCSGCPVCRKCEPLQCDACPGGESTPTTLSDGCPGCAVCKPSAR